MTSHVLALVVCVIALAGGSSAQDVPPNYVSNVAKVKEAHKKLKELTPHVVDVVSPVKDVDLKNPKAHYAQLLSVVDDVSTVLATLCAPTYDDYYYEGVKRGVRRTLESAVAVGQSVLDKVQKAKETFQVFVDLVDTLCSPKKLGCDYAVREELEKNKEKYEAPYKNFLLALNVSQLFLDNTYEEEAKRHEVFKLLVEGKDTLKGLVFAVKDYKFSQSRSSGAVACPVVPVV